MNKCYVKSVDTFMSNWGHAKGLTNLLIFECEDWDQAEVVAENANNRTDQIQVEALISKPVELLESQDPKGYVYGNYYVQVKTINEYPNWYRKGAF